MLKELLTQLSNLAPLIGIALGLWVYEMQQKHKHRRNGTDQSGTRG